MTDHTERLYVDYSYARPDPAHLAKIGYAGVIRYLSHTDRKDVTADEIDKLHAAGLEILLVWETTAARAGEGHAAGAADRHEAERRASTLGYHGVIFYAVDFDADPDAVLPYFRGIADGGRTIDDTKHPAGVYGSRRVVDAVKGQHKLAARAWQTEAWSGGTVSSHADLLQRVHPAAGTPDVPDTDQDVIVNGSSLRGWLPPQHHQQPGPHHAAADLELVRAFDRWTHRKGI